MWSVTCSMSKMAREKKTYDDDDGRTIADMSGVTRRNLLGIRLPESAAVKAPETESPSDRPWDTSGQLSREERRSFILGTISAGLLIGAPFAIVFAIFIYLIGHVHF